MKTFHIGFIAYLYGSKRVMGLILTLTLLYLGHLLPVNGQIVPDMGFVMATINETISGLEENTGLTREKSDTFQVKDGTQVILSKTVKTKVYRKAGKIFYEHRLTRFDPRVEAPESYWWNGLANLEGEVVVKMDSSEWLYSVLPEYYHPVSRYIITIASVYEEYKPHHMAILDMDGNVVCRMDMPYAPAFSLDRSVVAYFYKKEQEQDTPYWQLLYRNLDTGKTWEKTVHAIHPRIRQIDPKDNGLVYAIGDTLFYLDHQGVERSFEGKQSR